ncbi:hypothetical protein KCA1_2163 [Lactiplantibacillus pentosus KCA1]|nr:hypothetical protein [Lactiplantibacillus pentosus]EIW13135.1 hypothetical protein KCA1_2163 [Lactiplantibacillus pentosus KCA1]
MAVIASYLGAGVVGSTAVSSCVQPQIAQAATIPSENTYKNPSDGVTYHKVGNHWYNDKNAEDSQELAEAAGSNFVNFKVVDNETGEVIKTVTNFSMSSMQITDLSGLAVELDGYTITDYVDQYVTETVKQLLLKYLRLIRVLMMLVIPVLTVAQTTRNQGQIVLLIAITLTVLKVK